MKRSVLLTLFFGGMLAMAGFAPLAGATDERKLVLVINLENPVGNINLHDLRDIYFGKRRYWSDGERILLADLVERKAPESKSAMARFAREYLGKDLDSLKGYWVRMIFSGAGQPPKQLSSAKKVIAFVEENEGALAYLYADQVTDAVKVVAVSSTEE